MRFERREIVLRKAQRNVLKKCRKGGCATLISKKDRPVPISRNTLLKHPYRAFFEKQNKREYSEQGKTLLTSCIFLLISVKYTE